MPLTGRVTGILADTPDHTGSKLYYNLSTAQALARTENPLNRALVNSDDPEALKVRLEGQGWSATTATQMAASNDEAYELFDIGLKGAGVLGLLVGGIGIANTMQVLLARRTREIAVLKTLGYSQGDLLRLFAIETSIMALAGSVLGAVAGIGVACWFVSLFEHTTNLLLTWSLSPLWLVSGMLVGIATTLIFAAFAIVRSSQVSPAALLRNERVEIAPIGRLKQAGLLLGLAFPFLFVTSLVMGSVLEGLGVILVALAGLIVLGGILGGSMWLVVRVLPVGRFPLANMARSSLRRRGLGLVFPMIALFTGVVTLTLAAVVTQGGNREMLEHSINFEGFNLTLIADAKEETALEGVLNGQPLEGQASGYQTAVTSIRVVGAEPGEYGITPVLIGRNTEYDYLVSSGAEWGGKPEGVYTPLNAWGSEGSLVEVKMNDGTIHTLPVVGAYGFDYMSPGAQVLGLLMDADLLLSLGQPDSVTFFARAPEDTLGEVSQVLGAALPQATVINHVSYFSRWIQTYKNLFFIALSMAGLALLAGVLLVANAVSLAMINRRYEIGVMKAVGYSRRQVLAALAMEYTLVALIASALGMVVVQVFLLIVGHVNDLAGNLLRLEPATASATLVGALGLILLTVQAVAWKPTRVSPVVILQDRA